ncbi:MAG: glycosyltransferase [Acidimicrobiales bacterium]
MGEGAGGLGEDGPEVDVEVVIPVHDEAAVVESSVRRVHAHLERELVRPWQLTIAENGSTDDTLAIVERLATELDRVRARHLDEPGRGRALRTTWSASHAAVRAYLDVDLSTDLAHHVPLVELVAGGADVAIGSRLAPGADTRRGPRREGISRTYNALVRRTLRVPFHDAQCGFKAISARTAELVLPDVADDGWFFDTELLVLAHRRGLRVAELPVRWVDDPDSSVRIVATAIEDLRGIARLARTR